MNFVNLTKLQAGPTMAAGVDGRESIVVVAKATYGFPTTGEESPPLLAEQAPLVTCDVFSGEPGSSPVVYEMDFAPRKPRCDVLLNGSAYAPGGKPTDRVTVGLQVGAVNKSFDVVGNRKWLAGAISLTTSATEPFATMPISYGNAFGGVDRSPGDAAKHRWYLQNPAGVGYHEYTDAASINDKPLPNTEEAGKRVNSPKGSYRPMAFGPVGRSWPNRIKWAGTYDQKWLDEQYPFLPTDFDERYFQAAPDDQQIDHLRGGEEVSLLNLTPQGRTTFRIPKRLALPIVFVSRTGDCTEQAAVVDTLIVEPDRRRFLLVWRTSMSLQRTIREISDVVVGCTAAEWPEVARRRRRQSRKKHYASLSELLRDNRSGSTNGASRRATP